MSHLQTLRTLRRSPPSSFESTIPVSKVSMTTVGRNDRTDLDISAQRAAVEAEKAERAQKEQLLLQLHNTTQLFPPASRCRTLLAGLAEARRRHRELGDRKAGRWDLTDEKVYIRLREDLIVLMTTKYAVHTSNQPQIERYEHAIAQLQKCALWDQSVLSSAARTAPVLIPVPPPKEL